MIRVISATTGYEAVLARLDRFGNSYTNANLQKNAMDAAEYAKKVTGVEMDRSGGGVFWPGNRVESSLPGKYPAIQEGDLVRSLNAHPLDAPPDVGRAALDAGGSGVPQAFYMEFGRSGAAPRPYMRTTVRKYEKEIKERLGAKTVTNRMSMMAVKYY
jgi:hypothetical protein